MVRKKKKPSDKETGNLELENDTKTPKEKKEKHEEQVQKIKQSENNAYFEEVVDEDSSEDMVQITEQELEELKKHLKKAVNFKHAVQQIQQEADEYRDQLLRLQAEFDNYRKRILKEKENIQKFALENFFQDMIPVYDNFLHAQNAIEGSQKAESIKEGVEYIFISFIDLLKKHGFEKIDAVGKKFDPNFHEAVLYEKMEGAQPMEVVEELQPGYIYNNRVIKPTLVKVAK